MAPPVFEQSLPLCYALSAIGGILEVGATAVLAVPDEREKEGATLPWWLPKVALASNVIMQLLGSLASNLFATWFGPVSVVAPIYFSATLVSNLIIFGFLLGLEIFDKIMIIGTYVIAIGTVLLQVVGPGIQADQVIGELLRKPYASLWFSFLMIGMILSTILMLHKRYEEYKQIAILLVARSTSYTLNLTVSRAFLLDPTYFVLITFVVIKIVSGAIYTYAIVIQSTTVTQSKFVPLNATCIILVNAITGVIIWEDWRVISSWTGYICVFLLLALGCELLLSSKLLLTNDNPEYGAKKRASIIIESTPMRNIFLRRSVGSRDLYANIPSFDEDVPKDDSFERVHNYISRQESMADEGISGSRRDAWKSLLSIEEI
ncbi:hypothetical protein ACHAWF_018867 [Thalassiosira exigua]